MTSKKITKDDLLALTLPREDVEVPGLGSVTVRGMTRGELVAIQSAVQAGDITAEQSEARVLALALVEPALTEAEAAQLVGQAPAGTVSTIGDAVARLSGTAQGAAKEAVKAFRG